MPEVFASLGSNQDREHNIQAALSALHDMYGELRQSPLYLSKSVGFEGEDFLNLVVAFNTQATPSEIVDVFHRIESEHGRQRDGERFGPRSLDIDLILYGDTVCSEPVQLPRVDILTYAFVLKPLADLAPERMHPVLQETYAVLWDRFAGARDLRLVDSGFQD